MLFPRALWFLKHQSGTEFKRVGIVDSSSIAENVKVSMVNLILEGKVCYIIESLQKFPISYFSERTVERSVSVQVGRMKEFMEDIFHEKRKGSVGSFLPQNKSLQNSFGARN